MGDEHLKTARIRNLERQNEHLIDKIGRLETALEAAQKERDDALKALGAVYVANVKAGRV